MTYIERPRFSCALGGALSTISALPRVVPIVHATSGCGANLFGAYMGGSGFWGSGYCGGSSVPTSGITENDIVFGGSSRLNEQIETTLEMIDADLFLVTTGCMTEIIGDDVEAVLRNFKDSKIPILSIETGGFRGNSYNGYEGVLEKLFNDYSNENTKKRKNLVNIFGLIPASDPFFRGDLVEIKRLLEKLGLEVNTFFTNDQTINNLRNASGALLNIVLSRTYGISVAESFKEKHGIPYYVSEIPIGPTATAEFLRDISKLLEIDNKKVEALIKQENENYYKYIERISDVYADSDFQHYAIVVGNANNTLSITKFLYEDLGWIPKFSVITDELDDNQKAVLNDRFEKLNVDKEIKLIYQTDASKIEEHLTNIIEVQKSEKYHDALSPLFILGSSWEKDFANKVGAKILSVSYPILNRAILDRGYAGYNGGLHLVEDLLDVIFTGR
ncbi:nitrogenase component 1 [Clostridium pasteurianum]|uniref:Nitrogenase molybdenum-iron protein, alpha and beta chains n=1 Tax=Clostridium pasteurianum BC1 TaxID=86416 RepID=R4KIS7_CLOPA|nr:nitrogenase component 1 [Clostridium pasteurianum]AGK99525.1 nitrogenase molybdenum-iron protein, alpha and beta chains [Clostridium pasteurianum BC1]